MLVKMSQQEFQSLDDEALLWACMQPTIQMIRGKDYTVKSQVYAQLNEAQQALLMFCALYGHSHSVPEFYWFVSHYLSQSRTWSELKAGARYFGEDDLLAVYEQMEEVLEARNRQANGEWRDVSVLELDDDPALVESVSLPYATYHQITPGTIRRIRTYIHNNPEDFVQFVE